MTIKFICPNGHHLATSEDRAGKPGRCPKCGVAFLVPDERHQGAAVQSPLPPQNLIIFLCPNGHRLNAPVSLKGKPGQCPHCGMKFKIPTGEDDHASRSGLPPGTMVDQPEGLPGDSGFPQRPEDLGEPLAYEDIPLVDSLPSWEMEGQTESGGELADLFAWLWAHRDPQSGAQLHLQDGAVFRPQHYAAQLSQGGYGVFAVESDGKYTLTAIRWDAVARIDLPNVEALPDDFGI